MIGLGLLSVAMVATGCTSAASSKSASSSASPGSAAADSTATTTTSAGTKPAPPTAPTTAPIGPAGTAVPSGFRPYSVTYIDTTHGWALGTARCPTGTCTTILRTRDGRTWAAIPAPPAAIATGVSDNGFGRVAGLRFADQRNGWAFGDALYSTHDGGATWRPVGIGAGTTERGPVVADVATSAGYAWAAVRRCSLDADGICTKPTTQLYRSSNGSDSWQAAGSPAPGFPGVADVVTAHGNQAWLVTTSGLYTSTGAGLRQLPAACPGAVSGGPVGFAVADQTHLDALCESEGAAGSATKQLVGSSDGGQTWRADGSRLRVHSGSDGIADNTAGVLLSADVSGTSVVRRTTDDGRTFTVTLSSGGGGISWHDLGFTTPNRAVVVLAASAVFQSDDSGRHWHQIAF